MAVSETQREREGRGQADAGPAPASHGPGSRAAKVSPPETRAEAPVGDLGVLEHPSPERQAQLYLWAEGVDFTPRKWNQTLR